MRLIDRLVCQPSHATPPSSRLPASVAIACARSPIVTTFRPRRIRCLPRSDAGKLRSHRRRRPRGAHELPLMQMPAWTNPRLAFCIRAACGGCAFVTRIHAPAQRIVAKRLAARGRSQERSNPALTVSEPNPGACRPNAKRAKARRLLSTSGRRPGCACLCRARLDGAQDLNFSSKGAV